jgi:hypothetical protein
VTREDIIETFGPQNVAQGVPATCDGQHQTIGLSFSGNPDIDSIRMIASHWQYTAQRIRSCPVVLWIAAPLDRTSTASEPSDSVR